MMGSNSARGMDVSDFSVFVLSCVGRGHADGQASDEDVAPVVKKIRTSRYEEEEDEEDDEEEEESRGNLRRVVKLTLEILKNLMKDSGN
jgi:hypothetical protein